MTLIKVKGRGAENLGRRNLIINGAMQVAQRDTQASVTIGYGGCDRYQFARGGATVVSLSRNTNVPTGSEFTRSLRINCTTADTSLAAGDYAMIRQKIEGQNLQHLQYGTSSAKKLTLQFWVRSPKTGIHVVELYHGDVNYFNCQQYTVTTANTWQKVVMTFDGYQTTALDNDNGTGIQVAWWLAAGSTYSGGTHTDNSWHNVSANRAVGQVNVMDDTANNFYLTGVQLEVGDNASDFEHRSYGEELTLCQRYYNRLGLFYARTRNESASSQNPDHATTITFPPMRDAPTINTYTDANYSSSGTSTTGGSSLTINNISISSATCQLNSNSSGAANVSNSAYLELEKEL